MMFPKIFYLVTRDLSQKARNALNSVITRVILVKTNAKF